MSHKDNAVKVIVGVEAGKSANPQIGELYFATDTQTLYVCYATGTWYSLKKDATSGVAQLDSSGNILVPGNTIKFTRDGQNEFNLAERTSGESGLRLTRRYSNTYNIMTLRQNLSQPVAVLDHLGDIPHMRPKVASANLRHSNDTERNTANAAITAMKNYIFNNGATGTIRIVFDLKNTGGTAYGQLRKNGVNIGALQSEASGAYVTKSQDIDITLLLPGDTIELWGYNTGGGTTYVRNFRIYYDNAADSVTVRNVVANDLVGI